jgi:hypothetical protein
MHQDSDPLPSLPQLNPRRTAAIGGGAILSWVANKLIIPILYSPSPKSGFDLGEGRDGGQQRAGHAPIP